ncbi:MAG: ATP-dependent Clp protease adaptor ClpS [Acidobacteria bacterium]|nr:ATP-dependent Clp protease adaptor ClpS [Acidobacteriota bacterium]
MPPTLLPDAATKEESQEIHVPIYNCVLLDDEEHSYDYVIEMLQKLFLLPHSEAYRHAVEVDTMGRTIVLTAELPVASYARDQIHSFGADWRIPKSKGSMSAILEPAGGGTPA